MGDACFPKRNENLILLFGFDVVGKIDGMDPPCFISVRVGDKLIAVHLSEVEALAKLSAAGIHQATPLSSAPN